MIEEIEVCTSSGKTPIPTIRQRLNKNAEEFDQIVVELLAKSEVTDGSDISFISGILLGDPETSERLTIETVENNDDSYSITVGNMDGDRKWKHTITTVEV
jgi:predicted ribosome-associated RNA-binding protein Tma20